ncbi:hypothetical protein ABT324_09280, partial [Saccharopolyspora sp. NPDC000359]|uniref:hypothetical protein n=1 Tax=Saccharopolyspora sp. NPDC000359 TaxID=3154251 RepID=UPI003321BA3E
MDEEMVADTGASEEMTDYSAEDDVSTEADYSSEADFSTETDYSDETDISAEQDYSAETDFSAEQDYSAEADLATETDYSAEADLSTESDYGVDDLSAGDDYATEADDAGTIESPVDTDYTGEESTDIAYTDPDVYPTGAVDAAAETTDYAVEDGAEPAATADIGEYTPLADGTWDDTATQEPTYETLAPHT